LDNNITTQCYIFWLLVSIRRRFLAVESYYLTSTSPPWTDELSVQALVCQIIPSIVNLSCYTCQHQMFFAKKKPNVHLYNVGICDNCKHRHYCQWHRNGFLIYNLLFSSYQKFECSKHFQFILGRTIVIPHLQWNK